MKQKQSCTKSGTKTAEERERLLINSDSHVSWRTQRRRRFVAAVSAIGFVVYLASSLTDGAIGALLSLVGWAVALGGWFFVRHLLRGMLDLPDSALDERQQRRRDTYYRTAYVCALGVFFVAGVGLLSLSASGQSDGWTTSDYSVIAASTFLFSCALPTLVGGWIEPDDLR